MKKPDHCYMGQRLRPPEGAGEGGHQSMKKPDHCYMRKRLRPPRGWGGQMTSGERRPPHLSAASSLCVNLVCVTQPCLLFLRRPPCRHACGPVAPVPSPPERRISR